MEKQAGQNPDIRIYVVCHKPAYVPETPYLYPIQVGTALSGKKLPGMLHDDEGDNISERNKTYCELTASIGPGKTKRRITMDFSIIAAIWHLTRRSIKMMDGEISPMIASQKKRSRK